MRHGRELIGYGIAMLAYLIGTNVQAGLYAEVQAHHLADSMCWRASRLRQPSSSCQNQGLISNWRNVSAG